MTDWSDVVRDSFGGWRTRTGRRPNVVTPANGGHSRSQWVRAAEFCQAVADALQAEAEAEEEEREVNLERKVFAAALSGDWHIDQVRAIIRAVREHDA